jgi:integrase
MNNPAAPPRVAIVDNKVRLTAGRVLDFSCPPSKKQTFLWDTEVPGLALRATAGSRAYIFERRFNGQTVRMTIGNSSAHTLDEARRRGREIQREIDAGRDPREVKAERTAADVATREAARRHETLVSEAWAAYLAERKPLWSDRTYQDHLKLAQLGGTPHGRVKGAVTTAGPLAELMSMPLRALDADAVLGWVSREAPKRPARVRLAMRLLKAFLRWCAAESAYKDAVCVDAASGKKAREKAGTSKPKADVLQRDQLTAWFAAVTKIQNPVISAYLQCLLLTGARREELAGLRWDDVNTQWQSLAIRDKVEGERPIPLTPYVAQLLAGLPRANKWVFSSARFVVPIKGRPGHWEDVSKTGRLAEPSIAHRRACATAALDGLTLHGLRRSFKSLSEWLEVPVGVVAQIMGHKPSATAEKHYTRRPLDLLRVHHTKIESWVLVQGGIEVPESDGAGNRFQRVVPVT